MVAQGKPTERKAEVYTLEDEAHRRYMGARTAAIQARFLLDRLRQGDCVLDAGCGAGAITIGIAEAVAPGKVTGIDREVKQIEAARAVARERGIGNVSFTVADIYTLPFDDGHFDAIFSNAVLEHLRDPVKALREFRRVLRMNGIVGIRNADARGNLRFPDNPLMLESVEAATAYRKHHGGDYSIGSRTKALLLDAGFVCEDVNATYESDSTFEAVHHWANTVAAMCKPGPFADGLVELGLADPEKLARIAHAWLEWAERPDAFQARAWVQGIGRKA